MSSYQFDAVGKGADPAEVFAGLVADAQYNFGHAGYTGTIAEKDDFVVICQQPLLIDDAYKLAEELFEADDERISDKWGPAGAIPLCESAPTMNPFRTVTGLTVSTTSPNPEEEVAATVELQPGEEIVAISVVESIPIFEPAPQPSGEQTLLYRVVREPVTFMSTVASGIATFDEAVEVMRSYAARFPQDTFRVEGSLMIDGEPVLAAAGQQVVGYTQTVNVTIGEMVPADLSTITGWLFFGWASA